ncbi:MAG: recombination mediator RecR, partial [bacterium]|nr:recombination mediator RecR [bacterium]
MSSVYTAAVQVLIDELGRLPGIGPKSAQRIAFHLLKVSEHDAVRLAEAIKEAKARVQFCRRCFNISEHPECELCTDHRRDPAVLCVVEDPRDIVAVEKTRDFRGRYHVLGGSINPIEGIGPDQLPRKDLPAPLDAENVPHAT